METTRFELTETEAREQLSTSGARMFACRTFSVARRENRGWTFRPIGVAAQVQLAGDRPYVVADNGLVAPLPDGATPDAVIARLGREYASAELDF